MFVEIQIRTSTAKYALLARDKWDGIMTILRGMVAGTLGINSIFVGADLSTWSQAAEMPDLIVEVAILVDASISEKSTDRMLKEIIRHLEMALPAQQFHNIIVFYRRHVTFEELRR